MCSQRKTPLIFLQNITGFMVGKNYEHNGIAKHGAKLVSAVSNANVPKITAILGGSFGAGNYGMCGRAYDPRFLFMLPSGKTSVMGGEQAAQVLTIVNEEKFKRMGKEYDEGDKQKLIDSITQKFATESDVYYSTTRLWDDGIVKPSDLRRVLGMSLTSTLNSPIEDTKSGVFRM